MTQCTDKMSELAAKAIEICNKKYIKSVMNTGWMETRENSRWESRTKRKRIACTGNEEHHSLDTVPRTLFSAVKLSHVMFRASPKGLHWSPQDKMTSQQKMLQHPLNGMATKGCSLLFPHWPVGKTDINFKPSSNGQNQQLFQSFMEAEVNKNPKQQSALWQTLTPKGYQRSIKNPTAVNQE